MDKELEELLMIYKHLSEIPVVSSAEKVDVYKKKTVLWWQIRELCRNKPRSMQMKIYRSAHPEKAFEQWLHQRDRNQNFKVEVLTHYGNGKCACVKCGESRVACLSIDHIEGGGNKQRVGRLRASTAFYRWLKREGYPEGYQTLCMNDQFVKRFEREEHN